MVMSKDPQQKYLFVADAHNDVIWEIDRQSGKTLGNFGRNGTYAGQFHWINSIAMDSKGNIYITETYEGKRVQKFSYKGLGPVTKENQGVVWPTRTSTH